jgi:hypothetical protein
VIQSIMLPPLDAAMSTPLGDYEGKHLGADLLKSHLSAYREVLGSDVVSLDHGLALVSRQARQVLGYDAVILLLDELMLWLCSFPVVIL